MTDSEFNILDELYFVKSLEQLNRELNLAESTLLKEIQNLIAKGWVRIIDKNDQEIIISPNAILKTDPNHRYIATKQGLKAHNQV